MIKISVPGKIHLLGEHTVVYGKPALLAAIDLRVTITLSPADKNLKLAQEDPYDENAFALQKIIETAIQKKFQIKKIPAYRIKVESDIPIGYGLGSSAAISSGYTAALLEFLKIKWDYKLVNEIAYEGEKLFHGNPSGGDVAAVIYGGFTWFRKEFEGLKIIQPLDQKVHPNVGQFFLIDSGKPVESTRELVQGVGLKLKAESRKLKALFDDQEQLTKNLLIGLTEGNSDVIIDSIRKGEKNLEKLGVVGAKVKRIVQQIEAVGGACKISGGGGIKEGAGMLIAYHSDSQKLLSLFKNNSWNYLTVRLGEKGLVKK